MKAKQLDLALPKPKGKHGGKREGAGRPKQNGSDAPHRARPVHKKRHPVHVVLRAKQDVPRLRKANTFAAIRAAMRSIGAKLDFRVVHASIQKNHLHFLVEAEDTAALTRGMQAFAISLARRINVSCGRRGKVFAHRYHATTITNPLQARNALAYVLNNWRRHYEDENSLRSRTALLDPYSTALAFDGWREGSAWTAPDFTPLPAARPATWLLRVGWRHHPAISVHEVPEDQSRRSSTAARRGRGGTSRPRRCR